MKTTRWQAAADILIIVLEIIGLAISTINHGLGQFVYYTQDSNYVLLICTAIHLFFLLKDGKVPDFAARLKYTAACLTTVTLLVVIFVLAPIYHMLIWLLVSGAMLYQHTLCPLLAIISFLAFDRWQPSRSDVRFALIPTGVYAVVLITLNFLRVVKGPYPFLYVYEQPWYMSVVWAIVIIGAAYGIAAGLRALSLVRKTHE